MRPAEPLFHRSAGLLALAAGAFLVIAQLVMLPFDPKDHVPTSQSVQFQIGGVLYLVGFCTLLFALIGLWEWQNQRAGARNPAPLVLAVLGTMLLGGDLWFETFAVPWIADSEHAALLDSDPTILIGLGAVSSYLIFAIGWASFGIATFRAGVYPRLLGFAIAVSGVLGFRALLSPFGVPLGLTLIVLGVWVCRQARLSPSSAPWPAASAPGFPRLPSAPAPR